MNDAEEVETSIVSPSSSSKNASFAFSLLLAMYSSRQRAAVLLSKTVLDFEAALSSMHMTIRSLLKMIWFTEIVSVGCWQLGLHKWQVTIISINNSTYLKVNPYQCAAALQAGPPPANLMQFSAYSHFSQVCR